jgi:site-specific recombinase XerD
MSDPSRVRITGPLSSFAKGFAAKLAEQGYRPNAAANQLQLIAHLSRWLAAMGMDARKLATPVLETFLATRRAQGYTLWLSPRALMPFLDYLRDRGFALPVLEADASPTEELLARYRRYLLEARALADTTARGYADMVRPFVARRAVDGQLDWASLRPADVTAFVRSASRGLSAGSAQLLTTALRSLLGYLHVEGLIRSPLGSAVPSVACPSPKLERL